jgi:hypothetical protein
VTSREGCRTACHVSLFSLASGHSRDRIATNPCERGSRGCRDWPGFAQPDPLFGNREMRIRSEGGQATGRCYSFLKLALRHGGRGRPVLGPAALRLRSGSERDPCWHVSIAVDAGHPTGECKVPWHRTGDVSSRAGRHPGLVGTSCVEQGMPSPSRLLSCLCQTSRGSALLGRQTLKCVWSVADANNLSKAPSARQPSENRHCARVRVGSAFLSRRSEFCDRRVCGLRKCQNPVAQSERW